MTSVILLAHDLQGAESVDLNLDVGWLHQMETGLH